MRKLISALCLTAAAALVVPAGAQAARYHRSVHHHHYRAVPNVVIHHERPGNPAASYTAGAAAGTAAALGTFNGWWGTGAFASTLPDTAVGSAALGGVVGIGSVALVDAALQPCKGFAALFDLSHGECVNGEYVGYAPPAFGYRE